jgi:uncharacterized protein YjiS (DUF1127 family)
VPALVAAVLSIARIWRRRWATRSDLQLLDSRELKDIGYTEYDRRRECSKWFWQA